MKYKDVAKQNPMGLFWSLLIIGLLLLVFAIVFAFNLDNISEVWELEDKAMSCFLAFLAPTLMIIWSVCEYKSLELRSDILTKLPVNTSNNSDIEINDLSENDIIYHLPENLTIFDYNEALWKQNI